MTATDEPAYKPDTRDHCASCGKRANILIDHCGTCGTSGPICMACLAIKHTYCEEKPDVY